MARSAKLLQVTLDVRMARHSGIGRYVRALCGEFAAPELGLQVRLLVPRDPLPPPVDALDSSRISFPAPIYSVREQWQGSWICQRHAQKSAIWHFPHYNVPWLLPANSVVTIHDVTHFTHPGSGSGTRRTVARRLMGRVVRRAGHLITPTAGAREALEALFPEARGKTRAIRHGVDSIFRRLSHEAPRAPGDGVKGEPPILLYVGNDKPHKNLPRLVEAFTAVRSRHPEARLVLAGRFETLSAGARDGVEVRGEVDDEQLVRWYNRAAALVLPSLNEGFGLTALEAMACGTPVVGADIPPIREVVGPAGLLVDPRDVGQLSAAMNLILDNPPRRVELAQFAERRSREFVWRRAAEETIEVYRGVLER